MEKEIKTKAKSEKLLTQIELIKGIISELLSHYASERAYRASPEAPRPKARPRRADPEERSKRTQVFMKSLIKSLNVKTFFEYFWLS